MSEGQPTAEEIKPNKSIPENKIVGMKDAWRSELSGAASLQRINHQGRNLRVVSGEHYSQKAADFFQKDIAPEITNPSDWIFLIEGKDTATHEIKIAEDIANEKNIPVVDPIITPFEPEVINRYLASGQTPNLSREVVIGILGAKLIKIRCQEEIEDIALILNTNSKELSLDIALAMFKLEENPDIFKTLSSNLTKISNTISAQVFDYYLREYPDRKNVAVYLGAAHEEIVTGDLSKLPKEMRLTDDKIKQILDNRKRVKELRTLKMLGIDLPQETNRSEFPPEGKSPYKKTKKILETIDGKESKEINEKTFSTENKQQEQIYLEKKKKVSKILEEIPGVQEPLKEAILYWSDNLFGLDDNTKQNYQNNLSSKNSLHQVWGAAGLLALKRDKAEQENRELSAEEMTEVKEAFEKAAQSRAKNEIYKDDAKKLSEIASGIGVLAKIAEKY